MSDTCWIPPDTKEMLGEWWEQYARRKGITWEVGPPKHTDQHGRQYTTLLSSGPTVEGECGRPFFGTLQELFDSFESSITNFLGPNKHVIWRAFPQFLQGACPTTGRRSNASAVYQWMDIRARLTVYPQKTQ